MKVKKTSTIEELQKIMKKEMVENDNVSKKRIRNIMEKFVNDR
jgi:hypothetical protein